MFRTVNDATIAIQSYKRMVILFLVLFFHSPLTCFSQPSDIDLTKLHQGMNIDSFVDVIGNKFSSIDTMPGPAKFVSYNNFMVGNLSGELSALHEPEQTVKYINWK